MEPINYHFNIDLIRENLIKKRKSQAGLAHYLGVTDQTIINILKSGSIRVDMLEKIAEFLDMSVVEFFYNKNVNSPTILIRALQDELERHKQENKSLKKENEMLQKMSKMADILLEKYKFEADELQDKKVKLEKQKK